MFNFNNKLFNIITICSQRIKKKTSVYQNLFIKIGYKDLNQRKIISLYKNVYLKQYKSSITIF